MGTERILELASNAVRPVPLDGPAERFVALLGLPDDDPEVRDIALIVHAGAEQAVEGNQSALLGDALRFAQGRLLVRGLSDAGVDVLGAALLTAAGPLWTAADVRHLGELVSRCTAAPTVPPPGESAGLAAQSAVYVEHLLRGDRKQAVAFVRRCTTGGMDVAGILLDILEPAQREVGRRWALGLISVAQEHFCTAVTEFVMTDLYPGMFDGAGSERRLLAVQAPGSRHHVGLRMVTDILECRGWSTSFLGEDVAIDELPALLAEDGADILLISASMPNQIPHVRAMIRAVRQDPRTRGVKVIVGGRPFLVAPDLVDAVGANGWAPDARSAVDVCNALMGGDHAGERR